MSDSLTLQFIPWMRRGLASAINQTASDGLPTTAASTVSVSVAVAGEGGETVEQSIRLRGPGDIVGLSQSQIVREDPPQGSQNFEPNYFPALEVSTPDLPWMFTPASASDDKLVPWLMLVAVEDQSGTSVSSRADAPLPVLTIDTPAHAGEQLGNPTEAWAWVHVQTSASLDETTVDETYEQQPETFLARFICPRRLTANTRYIACLVPLFEAGRRAGLGLSVDHDNIDLAWQVSDESIELPVYHSWSFRCGPEGDFETLVRRLTPYELEAGSHDFDIGSPGSTRLPDQPNTLVSFKGALVGPLAPDLEWPANHKKQFQRDMRSMLNESLTADGSSEAADYDPLVDDPMVAPPAYGALMADEDEIPKPLPESGRANRSHKPLWLAETNLDPVHRGAGGLGAEVVRRNQETLMSSAWQLATGLRDINRLLNWTRMAAEVGSSIKTQKIDPLDDGSLLQLAGSAKSRINSGTGTDTSVAGKLNKTAVPSGVITAAFKRIARRDGTVGRAVGDQVSNTPLAATVANNFTKDLAASLVFSAYVSPLGIQVADDSIISAMPGVEDDKLVAKQSMKRSSPISVGAAKLAETAVVDSFAVGSPSSVLLEDGRLPDRDLIPGVGIDIGQDSSSALSELADVVKQGLDPQDTLAKKLQARITAPQSAWAGKALPTSMQAQPEFPQPLYEMLRRIDADYLLPGVGDIPDDSVGLTEVNAKFVEAFLLGANHELSREFLWREYPVDLSQTWLRTFWDAVAEDVQDIDEVSSWGNTALGEHQIGPGADATLVLVIKGELLRRYPDTVIYAVRGRWNTNNTKREEDVDSDGQALERRDPLFVGMLNRDTVFLGFKLSTEEAEGSNLADDDQAGWFFIFEEQPTGTRFGLDTEQTEHAGQVPAYWKDASWAHQVDNIDDLEALTHAKAVGRLTDQRLYYDVGTFKETWGKHAASMARITLQRPVRMLVHASAMLASGEH